MEISNDEVCGENQIILNDIAVVTLNFTSSIAAAFGPVANTTQRAKADDNSRVTNLVVFLSSPCIEQGKESVTRKASSDWEIELP
jgi:hypothetical protein